MAAINSRDIFIQALVPRLLTQTYKVNDLYITLQDTNIVVKLIIQEDLPKYIKNFSVKLWRQGEVAAATSTSDWWNNPFDPDNMLLVQTLDTATFNLLNLPSTTTIKRISKIGINYQIAARAIDNTDNFSSVSMLGSIFIKTIS